MWHALWGRQDVRVQNLGGQRALVMPYVRMATDADWERPEVRAAARAAIARIDEAGYTYADAHRRHLGLFRDGTNALHGVFVDLSSVVEKGSVSSLETMLRTLHLA
eukprot:Opistho-1_new@77372